MVPNSRSAFGAILADPRLELHIAEQPSAKFVTIMAHKGFSADRLEAAVGVRPPPPGSWDGSRDFSLISVGPGVWLGVTEFAALSWASQIAVRLEGIASVADQSAAYTAVRFAGRGARTLLSRGAYIDFHPSSFKAGSAANTMTGHLSATLWQKDNAPTYDLVVARSYTVSFRHWLEASIPGLSVGAQGLPC